MTRDGQVLDLAGATLQAMGEATFFELSGLRELIDQAGEYRLELPAAGSGISDFAGNALLTGGVEVFTIAGRTYDLDRQARSPAIIAHQDIMQLASGSINFTFNADLNGGTLLAKDGRGNVDGDLQIHYIRQNNTNRVRVQFFHSGRTHTLTSHALQNGVDYDVQVRFGQGGLRLFINGVLMGRNTRATGGLANLQDIVLGASNAGSTRGTNDALSSFFDGRIGDLTICTANDDVVFSDLETR